MRKRIAVLFLLLVCILSFSCGGAPSEPQTAADEPMSWWKKSIWVEKKDGGTNIMVVGRTEHASLDEGMAMDSAEQDAREKISIYLGATVVAFREKLKRRMSTAASRDGETSKAAEITTTDDSGGRTIAENTVAGLEVVNSHTDEKTDRFYVLGRLDYENFRSVLEADQALSEAERQYIEKNSDAVREEMDAALQDARSQVKR